MSSTSTPSPAFQRLRALLTSQSRKATLSHTCYTDMVTAIAIRVRVPTQLLGAGAPARRASRARVQRLYEKHFGRHQAIQIRDGSETVWQGAVRLAGIETPEADGDHVPVTLAFAAPLTTEDLTSLGLLAPCRPEPTAAAAPMHEDEPRAPRVPVTEAPSADAPESTPDSSRRKAQRRHATVPVAVYTTYGPIEAEMRDVSRTGLRFRIRTSVLGFEPSDDLHEIAERVAAAIPESFQADLNHAMVGLLLKKQVHLVRISLVRGSKQHVDVCGRFETPLLLEETTMLGVSLPPPEGSDEAWDPASAVVGPTAREVVLPERPDPPKPTPQLPPAPSSTAAPTPAPVESPPEADPSPAAPEDGRELEGDEFLGFTMTRRFRAVVRGSDAGDRQPLSCQTDLVGYGGVRLRVPRPDGVGGMLARAAAAFRDAYGSEPNLKLMDKADHLWTGPTRMVALDLPAEAPDEMLVTLAFQHALRPAEVRRLKLPAAIT